MLETKPANVGLDNHEEAFSIWLDAFRWIAAFAVLLSHVSHRVFLHFGDVPREARSPLLYLFGAVSSFGQPAVIVFFVLSGYLVGGGALRRFRKTGHFAATDYFVSRLTRLWLVLVPTFALTVLLNVIGLHMLGSASTAVYGGPTSTEWWNIHKPATFLCNMAFLQTAACNQYGGNGALWSLFNEFWYYLAWPLLMLGLWSRKPGAVRVAMIGACLVGLAVLTWAQVIGASIGPYFLMWLLGVVAADRARPLLPGGIVPAAIALAVALVIWRLTSDSEVQGTRFWKPFLIDGAISILFANLLMVMRRMSTLRYPPFAPMHRRLADFSFSLYCLHTPLINCLCAILMGTVGFGWAMLPVGTTPFLVYLLVVAICMIAAWLFSQATERHTLSFRRAVLARLRPAGGRVAPSAT